MSDLIRHPNAIMTHDKYHEWHAWYILPHDCNTFLDVPVGGTFGVVHTPAPYTTSPNFGKWTYTVWEVTMHQYKHDTESQRYYRVQAVRELTDDERAYYESITPAPVPRPPAEQMDGT